MKGFKGQGYLETHLSKPTDLNRNAFVITDTELNVMATLAMIGLMRRKNKEMPPATRLARWLFTI